MKFIKSLPYHAWLMLFSAIGLISSFWQTGQKIHGLKNPEAPLSCNINPIVECGTVLDHPLSAVMGVPNSMLGMLFFTTALIIGILMWQGVKLTKPAQKSLLGVSTVLMAFVGWFFLVSLYDIGKICICCIFIWISAVPIFVLTIREYGPAVLDKNSHLFIKKNYLKIISSVYVLGILLFLVRFREYYF